MNINEHTFHCPHCSVRLNADQELTLNTQRQNGDIGKIFLHTKFGNYAYRHVPEVQFAPGEIVAFQCPQCNRDVHSEKYKDFAMLKMQVTEKIVFDVLFSREAGKKRTYIVTEDGIESYSDE